MKDGDESPQNKFHNYTIDWTRERIQWWIDEKMIRELKKEEANGGKDFPQTPMVRFALGVIVPVANAKI